jgi:hypothetical protein
MALTFDLRNVKNLKAANPQITETVIFMTMFIGMYEITEKNVAEFYSRAKFYQVVFGAFLKNKGKDRFLTKKEIYQHIGLKTNASPMSKARFLSQVYSGFQRAATKDFMVQMVKEESKRAS